MQTTLGTGLHPERGKADWLQFGVQDKVQHRQVTEGYVQTHGIDYDETFTPIANIMMVHVVMAVPAAGVDISLKWTLRTYFFKATLKIIYLLSYPLVFSRRGTLCQHDN